MKEKLIIGSRASALAVRQAEIVKNCIQNNHKNIEIEIKTYITQGDRILDKNLDLIGGKGLFVRELDQALMEGKIDIAVHSLKDMPMDTPVELPILAYSEREDPRDILVLPASIKEWDGTGNVGCSSARRKAQLGKFYPKAAIKGIRGNIQTRLQKLDDGQYAALILACAGLRRLGLHERISRIFEPEEMLPAAGQGILAVQGKIKNGVEEITACVNDPETQACAFAERAFVRALGGGCSEPVAAFAQVNGKELNLSGMYLHKQSGEQIFGNIAGCTQDAEQLGKMLAIRLEGRSL